MSDESSPPPDEAESGAKERRDQFLRQRGLADDADHGEREDGAETSEDTGPEDGGQSSQEEHPTNS